MLGKIYKYLIERRLPDRIVFDVQLIAVAFDQAKDLRQLRILKGKRELDKVLVFLGYIRRWEIHFHKAIELFKLGFVVKA